MEKEGRASGEVAQALSAEGAVPVRELVIFCHVVVMLCHFESQKKSLFNLD
jgi:hypothetical protein